MVHYVKGDLFETDCDIICHQVNCQGVMGSGVALEVKKRYPVAFLKYKKRCEQEENTADLLGVAQFVHIENGPDICNMFAQNGYGTYGRYTNYEAFYHCLEAIRMFTSKLDKIAFPCRIGSCRGGADWDIIKLMIEKVLCEREVYIYEL